MEEIIKNYFLSEIALKECYEELFASSEGGDDWEICILINRKGYWDYKIFFQNEVINLKDGKKIYSDRYVEKCPMNLLKYELENKKIRIYDDSITHGSNLFYFYFLCKLMGAESVRPYVYACNTSFPSDVAKELMRREAERLKKNKILEEICQGKIEEDVEKTISDFTKELSYKVLLGNTDIERLSAWQTKLFQKHVSPLVMDLPIYNKVKGHENENLHIKLPAEKFNQLISVKTENWKFVDNIAYADEVLVKASYFRFYKKELWDTFPYLAHDFIVKCKYEECKDDNCVKVVFTPFAIVKSISYEKIWEAFELLYHDSSYAKSIINKENIKNIIESMEKDANLCKGLFRAVIFRISHYIGLKFKEMVQREIDIELECDWKIMYHNFCKEFIETEQEWENTFSEEEFLSVIAKYKDEKVHISKYVEYSLRKKRKATPERISNQMRETLIGKKKSVTLEAGDSDVWEKRIYQFEELENELEGLFIFDSEEERRQMITNVCISNLETNSFSNYLLAKGEEQVLYRGFRYGENSEVFLHESLWFFYIFLYVYYETCPDNELVKGYDNYMRKLRNYLESKGYLNVWISEDGFEFLKKYFGKFKKDDQELITEIRRRRYLLEYDRTVMKNQIGEIFLKEAYSVLDY